MPGRFLLPLTTGIHPLPVEWDLVCSISRDAPKIDGKHTRIPLITVPFLLTSKVLSFSVSSALADSSWVKGGILSQKIRTGRFVGGNPEEQIDWKFLPLGNSTVTFEKWDGEYALIITPARHLKQLTLDIFQPKGA